jgi:hypothetical protein
VNWQDHSRGRMRFISYASLPCAGVLAAVLYGCSGGFEAPVSVDYRQIGFCDSYAAPSGAQAARPNEVFIVYKIDTVDNTKRNSDFTFLPTRLWVERATVKQGADAGPTKTPGVAKPATDKSPWVAEPGEARVWVARRASRRFVPSDTNFAQAMGVRAATATVISSSAKTPINGYSIVTVTKLGEDRPVDQISFSLNYDPQEGEGWALPADPQVILNNTDGARASWPYPENCQDLALDKVAT